jgi:hypothetical protein
MLEEMVSRMKDIPDPNKSLPLGSDDNLNKMIDVFLKKFSGSFQGDLLAKEGLLKVLQEMANHKILKRRIDAHSLNDSRDAFLAHFQG